VSAWCCIRCENAEVIAGERFMFARSFPMCPDCGNKRCPRASDHRLGCTGSNEPNQPGSVYQDPPSGVFGEHGKAQQ
jgi:hypothetical protein